jgi:AraC-like DNA-binding protein
MYLTFDYDKLPEIHKIGHSICTTDWSFTDRFDIDYELILVTQGTCIFYFEKYSCELYPGDMLLIEPYQIHGAKNPSNSLCRFFYVHFMPKDEIQLIDESSVQREILVTLQNTHITEEDKIIYSVPKINFKKICIPMYMSLGDCKNEIFTLMEKAIDERNHTTLTSELTITLYISEILVVITKIVLAKFGFIKLLNIKGKIPRVLQEAMLYINQNYNKILHVNDIAAQMQISPQHLTRLFKENIGKSTIQYVNELRISKAKDLMREKIMTIGEITYAIGLENPYYFSRLFKRLEGISPSEYKRKLDSKSNE